MHIKDNIIKHYLKNVYFINGTAYAGKSSVCKALADRHDMVLCGENYAHTKFLSMSSPKTHPNMHYFTTMADWEAFVSRSKEEYDAWLRDAARELVEFEITELIARAGSGKKVIVDTNLPHDVLTRIASPHHVIYMVATPEIAATSFFDRPDREKQFLYGVLEGMDDPEAAIAHYREVIRYVNRHEIADAYRKTEYPVIERLSIDEPLEEKIHTAEQYFHLDE